MPRQESTIDGHKAMHKQIRRHIWKKYKGKLEKARKSPTLLLDETKEKGLAKEVMEGVPP